MRRVGGLVVLLGVLSTGACGLLPAAGPAVHLDNMTRGPVAVHMEGAWVGTYPPGTSVDVPLMPRGEPLYEITVHSTSGRVLAQLEIDANAIEMASAGSGGLSSSAKMPCGTVSLSFGVVAETPPTVAFADLPPCS